MQDYYLGLDVGTNSVGWAVTDEHYNLIKAPVKGKYKNHDMWGIRLFEKAKTAEDRRHNRSLRRRIQRQKNRIALLQDIFKEEIAKVDDTFFIRLNESRLQRDDKTVDCVHPLFYGNGYTDKEYYKEYPTIFHLRQDLIHNPKEHDIRMVYLALHNIIKYRGNFLVEGDYDENRQKDIAPIFQNIVMALDEYGLVLICSNLSQLKEILSDNRITKNDKAKEIKRLISVSVKDNFNDSYEFNEKKATTAIVNFIVGKTGNCNDLFFNIDVDSLDEEEIKQLKINFSDPKYDESQKDFLEKLIPEETEILNYIKALYDWIRFIGIMGEYTFISDAKVALYNKHKDNLKILKRLFKKYLSVEEYKEFFHSKDDKSKTYAAYIGVNGDNKNKKYIGANGKVKAPIKKCSEADFYKELKNKLDSIKDKISDEDRKEFEKCLAESGDDNGSLLPVLRNKDNGSIPRQVHELELKKILENASKYLPFLLDVDEKYNKSNIDKIISIFEFKIPYYVGPLSTRHVKNVNGRRKDGSNVWVQRKPGMENVRIYPWNFDDVIDKEKSNEQFIVRMTNKCTYLTQKDVLPKNSLLYQKYIVLNQLNNLKICGEKITVELKQEIYNKLFTTGKTVTSKTIRDYLNKNYNMNLESGDISGISDEFKASLSSEKEFKKVFHKETLTDKEKKIVEDVIRWKTIYGDDRNLIKNVVGKYYPELDKDIVKNIGKMAKMSGWGEFSKEFLTQVYCEEMVCKDTGEMMSIISALWETNENLMQLLSSKYGYTREIKKINERECGEILDLSYETCVEDLYTSPANKRAIWQTLLITDEITKVMGCEPKKIFIEMARGEDKNGKTNKSRKEQIKELYLSCESDIRNWEYKELSESLNNQSDSNLRSRKLFLYYMQQGKCAYTGEQINLQDLLSGNNQWDIDHIYPQSKIDDDGLNNIVLVKKKINAKKDNELLNSDIRNKMMSTWKYWLNKGFITKEKYSRLTRVNDFTEDELSGFIARQLVETRQSTKLIADLMQQLYDSKIIYVKASLTSKFRKDPLNVLKSRVVNDYHHAKDAYLNIVVGDVYNSKYTDNPYYWMEKNKNTNYSITKTMYWDVMNSKGDIVWKGCNKEYYLDEKGNKRTKYLTNENNEITGGDIDRIRKIARRETCFYTEYTYCDKGKLFDASHVRKDDSSSAKLALKKELDITKYGGYMSANSSYFAMIEFDGKKNERVKNIIGVPIYVDNMLTQNENAYIEYCENVLKLKNVVVLKKKIKKNALISVNGFPLRIRGESGKSDILLKSNLQLRVDENSAETIRRIEKYNAKKKENKNLEISEEHDGIHDESLMNLYDVFISKLEDTYTNRPSNKAELLKNNRDIFKKLKLENKVNTLLEIVKMLRCDIDSKANLSDIEGGKASGSIVINKNTLGKSSLKLINQSITGLFEQKERL